MLRAFLLTFIISWISLLPASAQEAEHPVPRTVLALYDNRGAGISTSYIHRLAEMPLNHLGFRLEYHDINQPLPDITQRTDVYGVITWFFTDTLIKRPAEYLSWASQAIESGKKYIIMGPLGVVPDKPNPFPQRLLTDFLNNMGISMPGNWKGTTFDVTYDYLTPEMFLVPDPYQWTRPYYQKMRATGDAAKVHLVARENQDQQNDSHLIITGPSGGIISAGYITRTNDQWGEEITQWYIDPFEFFRQALNSDTVPKPDTTTLAGRRIYYSHIDGDGWNNISRVENYRKKPTLSARVIMEEAVKAYPDLPVTLALITADISKEWVAVEDSQPAAKEFFSLPQVEAGSHTHSHPFYWQFFKNYSMASEAPFLPFYHTRTWQAENIIEPDSAPEIPSGYRVPRAYAVEPFNVEQEIHGSVRMVESLLPEGKHVKLMAWSGNCMPWQEFLQRTHMEGMQNINGGDSRFDNNYPAYASVAPIGKKVGDYYQIYASSSNENTYTNLWSENFFAHRDLVKTLRNTETPIRLKPLNIYYHIYAGERMESLNALRSNLEYARHQNIAPVPASYYTRIAEGFYTTEITAIGDHTWRIQSRGALQTIRFDRQSLKTVDLKHSTGVVGMRHFQGSLYVYLDASEEQPIIALKPNSHVYAPSHEDMPYVVESRWHIYDLKRSKHQVEFTAQGFGPGEMVWQVPSSGEYALFINGKAVKTFRTENRLLTLTINEDALTPLQITIRTAKAGGRNV